MAAQVTHRPQMQSVVLRVTNIPPRMTEEQFVNEITRKCGVVLRYIWRQLPDSRTTEAFVELENPIRALTLNQQRLSQNPSILKLEYVRDMKILNNLIHDLLLVDTPNRSTEQQQQQRGTVIKVSIVDAKLRVTIPALHCQLQHFGEVVMIALVGPKPLDEEFSTLQALVQYRHSWEAFGAYSSLNGKDFFEQKYAGLIIIELTDLNEICVTERVTHAQIARQYRNDHRRPAEGTGDLLETPVLHLAFIHEGMSEEQVFNIFTLYGNVVKIMFLDLRQGGKRTVLIQMGSITEAENARTNLNGFVMHRTRMIVRPGHTTSIVTNIGRAAYVGRPEHYRRREEWLNFPPTRTLRVSGVPSDFTIVQMRELFEGYRPTSLYFNSNTNDWEVDFGDVSRATEALAKYHGTEITPTARVIITFLQVL